MAVTKQAPANVELVIFQEQPAADHESSNYLRRLLDLREGENRLGKDMMTFKLENDAMRVPDIIGSGRL